ncbi:hypothetical protein BU15DRAFT_80358 [Melanogaster broomeanus]|nr:hypothetical protein BU15DRAFT_80358 [Melanogaster broomeanus]
MILVSSSSRVLFRLLYNASPSILVTSLPLLSPLTISLHIFSLWQFSLSSSVAAPTGPPATLFLSLDVHRPYAFSFNAWSSPHSIPFLQLLRSFLMSLDHFTMFSGRRFQPAQSHTDDHHTFSQHSSSWNPNQYSGWSTPSVALSSSSPSSPPPYTVVNSNYRHSGSSSFHQTNYPPSSPRSVISTDNSSLSSSLSPTASCPPPGQNNSTSISNTLKYVNPSWGDGLYTIDDPETASNSEPPASTSSATSPSARASSVSSSPTVPPVKVEPEDSAGTDCFVMEFSASTPAAQASSSLAPPTEVPLRATQAASQCVK